MAQDYSRRDHWPQPKDTTPDGGGDRAASADYFGNLKKFQRTDDMAAEPTRSKTAPKNR